MNRILKTFIFILLAQNLMASNEKAYSYIEKYKDIAVTEMRRSGIPASIKLAQGMLESRWGESELAVKANNHFGIKCGSQWSGPSMYRTDDDYGADGKKIESCFRAYDDAKSSYISHTDFLTEPKKQSRYGFLFDYASNDFEAWAKGLRQAGYATDPSYGDKLIFAINKYGLEKYDEKLSSKDLVNNSLPGFNNPSPTVFSESESVFDNQGLKYIIADGRNNADNIAHTYKISIRNLLAYNETILVPSEVIQKGEVIYLEQKRRDYAGKQTVYYVKQGDNLASISQMYGIRATSLRAINRIPRNEDVKTGQVIYLTTTSRNKMDHKTEAKEDNRRKSTKKKKLYLFEF